LELAFTIYSIIISIIIIITIIITITIIYSIIYSIIISIIYSIIISIIILGLERTRFELLRAASSCSVRRSVSCHDDSTPRRVAIGGTLQCGAKTSAVATYESYDPVN